MNIGNTTQTKVQGSKSDFKSVMEQSTSQQKVHTGSRRDTKEAKSDGLTNTKSENAAKTEPEKIEKVKEIDGSKSDEKVIGKAVDKVKSTVEELASAVCDELDVTPEELEEVLSILGLSLVSLLDESKLPTIVAKLTGNEETISLVTDTEAYDKLVNLSNLADSTLEEVAVAMNMTVEDVKTAIKSADVTKNDVNQESFSIPTNTDEAVLTGSLQEVPETFEEKIEITVSGEKANSQKNEFATYNPQSGEEVKKVASEPIKVKTDADKSTDFKNNTPQTFAETVLQRVTQSLNESMEVETQSFTTVDAENILNQITEFIKADITAETSEINMRLHPESLGTVSVKVSANNEGILTAQFTAQNESVKAIIESQAIVLKETLETKGVSIEAVEVTVESHEFERNLSDQNRGSNNGSRQERRSSRRINLIDEADEPVSNDDRIVREMMAQNGNSIDYSA